MNDPETIPLDKGSPTWPHVLQFAELMEHKLDQKRHKGDREGWLKDSPWALYNRICDEMVELKNALQCVGSHNAIMECADVANFAMMVADVVATRPETLSEVPTPTLPLAEKITFPGGFEVPVFSVTDKLHAIFVKHAQISQQLFGKDSERGPSAPAHHLLKEAKELVDHPTDISEMADVFNLLMDVCRRSGHDIRDLLKAVDYKLDVLLTRKWGQPDENGVIEHIRE